MPSSNSGEIVFFVNGKKVRFFFTVMCNNIHMCSPQENGI